MEALLVILWIAASLAFGAGLFFVISHVVSLLGGWHGLAEKYGVDALPKGKAFCMQSADFGGLIRYNSALTVVLTRDGVAMQPVLFLRWGHPALLLPYSAMTRVERFQRLWVRGVSFRVNGRRIRVYRSAGEAILKAFNDWAATHPSGRA